MKKLTSTFYCFSPLAMIATFFIEIALLIYVFARYKPSKILFLLAALLLSLATFQLAEYGVCEGLSLSQDTWSRIGLAAIMPLPAVAIHLVQKIAGRNANWITWTGYLVSVVLVAFFVFADGALNQSVCNGNYIIFDVAPKIGGFFFGYYYLALFVGIGLSLFYAASATKKTREALLFNVAGYLSFVLPTGVLNAMKPETASGLPSVMCGFAVLYALILVLAIAPRIASRRK